MKGKCSLGEELYKMKKGRYPSLFYKSLMRTYLHLIGYIDVYLLISICLLLVLLMILVCR